MSEHEEQTDNVLAICPYCKHSYQVEAEDYSEADHVVRCSFCGKRYRLRTEFSVEHITTPDCTLNGVDHDWEYSSVFNLKTCRVCDHYEAQR